MNASMDVGAASLCSAVILFDALRIHYDDFCIVCF